MEKFENRMSFMGSNPFESTALPWNGIYTLEKIHKCNAESYREINTRLNRSIKEYT